MANTYPTTINKNWTILAAPTSPNWKAEYDAYQVRKNDPEMRKLPNYNADSDLCSIQCAQHANGMQVAQIIETIYGFGIRTVHAGGTPIGPRCETYQAAADWAVNVWYAEAPDRREVITMLKEGGRA